VPQGDTWQLIHAVGRGKWAPGGVAGSSAPPKPQGPTPIPNNPLAPLTQNQIQRQASKTVSAAYGGANTDLNNQQAQAQNLYKTQTADDQYFANWLSTQSRALNDQVGQANQKLSGVLQGILQTQQTSLAQAPTQANGGVDNPNLDQATSYMQGAANARTAAAAGEGVQQGITGQLAAMNSGDVAQARLSATQNLELGNLSKTLTGIAGERSKLLASQIGDTAKEITRLQGVELSKRQWLRSEADLEQKAGVAAQSAGVLNATRQAGAVTARMRANTAAAQAKETATHNANMERINSTHYADQAAQAAARQAETDRHNRELETLRQQSNNTSAAKARGTTGAGGVKFGTPVQQRAVVNYMSNLQQALSTVIQRFHSGDPKALQLAYHDIQSGRAAKQGIIIPRPPSGAPLAGYLNAAANTLSQFGARGLTAGDIAFLNGQGLQVGSRYKRSSGYQRNAGAQSNPTAPSAANVNAATGA
jgi:hypothetical protein